MKIKNDKEGKKTEEVLSNGLKITTLIEPSAWYVDNVLKPMQEERAQRKQNNEYEEKIQQKMREMAEKELEKEKDE